MDDVTPTGTVSGLQLPLQLVADCNSWLPIIVGIPMAPVKDLLAFPIETFRAFHWIALYEYLEPTSLSPASGPRCRLIYCYYLCGLPETLELGQRPSIPHISQCEYASSCSYLISLALWRLAVRKERSAKSQGLNIVADEVSQLLEEYGSEG